jgi:hypothetical protein
MEQIKYLSKVKVDTAATTSYAINDATTTIEEKGNAQKLTEEFIINFRNARAVRAQYESKWNEMNLYLWNRKKETIETSKGQKPTETSQNFLFPIYQYKLAEICANNLITFNVSPARLPMGKIQKLKQEALSELSDLADSEDELAQIEEEITQTVYMQYVQEVEEFNGLIKQLWKRAVSQDLLKRVFTDGLTTGTSFIELVYNADQDSEAVSAVHTPIYDCFLEPGNINFQSSRYFIVSQKTNLLELKSNPLVRDNITPDVEKAIRNSVTSWQKDSISRENDVTGWSGVEQIPYHRYYKKYIKDGKVKVGLYHFVGDGERPILIYAQNDIGIDDYPFAPLFFNKRTDELYGKSFMDFLLPTQKMLNKYEAIVKLRLLQSARPHIFLGRNSGIDPKSFSSTRLTPGMVHSTNLENPAMAATVVQLDSIPGDFVNFLDRAIQNLNIIANMNGATTGDQSISGSKSGAVNTQLDRAMLPEKLNTLDVQTFIKEALRVLINWTTQSNNVDRTLIYTRDTDPSEYSVIAYKGTDYIDLSYNLNVDVKIQTATERQQEVQTMMQLWQAGRQYEGMSPVVTEEELVDRLDLSNKNESLIRLQAQKEQNLQTASEQILQVIQTALQQTIQSQQQQQIVQTAAESGQYTDEDLQKMQDQQQQPISHEDLVEVVTDIIKQTQGTVAQNATTQTGGETNE